MALLVLVLASWSALAVLVAVCVSAVLGRAVTTHPCTPQVVAGTRLVPAPRDSSDAYAGLLDTR